MTPLATLPGQSLAGKVALVTGGGGGIGRGIALALASAGAFVVVCGRKAVNLASVRAEIEGRGGQAEDVPIDITVTAGVDFLVARTIHRFGRIDVLVNNAAFVPHGDLLTIDDNTIDMAWRTGPLATLHLMQQCHPYLKGDGAIINISSGAAIAGNVPLRGMYAAVKAALNAISRSAAMEWAADGIRVNTVMPFAHTEATDRYFASTPAAAAAILESVPLGRLGDCEADIGRIVVFLAGPDASYLTGQTIGADGGLGYIR